MTNQHPITPPPELRCQWQSESPFRVTSVEREDYMIDRAAKWAADQELEACVSLVNDWAQRLGYSHYGAELRTARRPKPPSLKEQALAALNRYEAEEWCEEMTSDSSIIRRALEALPE